MRPLHGTRDLCFDLHLRKRDQPGFPEAALPAEIVARLPVAKERLLHNRDMRDPLDPSHAEPATHDRA
ncbi:hypothetical protein T190_07355 [Sinorhizobium meliloti CCBAU 01290]|nr:hypothetical protein T190_07355 [Sinorhizobium meliloti CCBAU 01290]